MGTYEDDILSLPDSVLENQAVIWEYLSDGSAAPLKPQITAWKYRRLNEENKAKRFAEDMDDYQNTFFMQLRSRMVHNEDTYTFLVEQTFWNANGYYLSGKGGYNLLKRQCRHFDSLGKEREPSSLFVSWIFSQSPRDSSMKRPSSQCSDEMLSHGSVDTLLNVLRNHVNSVANVNRENAERGRVQQ